MFSSADLALKLDTAIFDMVARYPSAIVVRRGAVSAIVVTRGMSDYSFHLNRIACIVTFGLWTPFFLYRYRNKLVRTWLVYVFSDGLVTETVINSEWSV